MTKVRPPPLTRLEPGMYLPNHDTSACSGAHCRTCHPSDADLLRDFDN